MKIKFLTVVISAARVLTGARLSTSAQDLSNLDGNAFLANPRTQQFLRIILIVKFGSNSTCNEFENYGSDFSNFIAYNSLVKYPPILVHS